MRGLLSYVTLLLPIALRGGLAQSLPSEVPVLQWVKQVGNSGQITAVASATDRQGNLYLVGNTSSLEFPVVSATQPHAGGSPLTRIESASGGPQLLLDPLLTNATKFAIDPESPSTLYAAAPSGLLRSADSGTSWARIDTFPPVSTITSITIDPSDSNVLYVTASAQGLFRSADRGITWVALNVALNQAIPPPSPSFTQSFYVNQLWVDAQSSSVLFASASSGLIRSPDSGASWAVVLKDEITSSLAFDPATPGTIYEAGSGQSSIDKSTDDGLTWTPLMGAPRGFPSQIVADPFHSGVLYLGLYSGLYQSKDGGATWILKTGQPSSAIAADPSQPVLYASLSLSRSGVVRSTDGFTTYQPVSAVAVAATQILIAGSQLFIATAPSTDLFVVKLDAQGKTIYSTYFGGSGSDSAAGLAVGTDGSVYVTGSTDSLDFPITDGAYLPTPPAGALAGTNPSFVVKLNPGGSLAWSTYFADSNTTPFGIAVDQAGNPYITGSTYRNLPVTNGAYQTSFQIASCGPGNIGPCPLFAPSAFLTKFAHDGSALVFSTYISKDTRNIPLVKGAAIALDPAGNAYIGGDRAVFLMSSDGDALLGSNIQTAAQVSAIVLDANNNLYATGWSTDALPATPGGFQTSPQPAIPSLPGERGDGSDAFVIQFDRALSKVLASTLLGGERDDYSRSIAIDFAGNIVLGGVTTSKAFPTRAPLQSSFSDYSGFLASFDPGLSTLLFSTYIGDSRFFDVRGVAPDASGNILLFGFTLVTGSSFCVPTPCNLSGGTAAFVNKIALSGAPPIRLDAVVNTASRYAVPLSPGESIDAIGSGFDSSTQLLLNGTPLPIQARGVGRLTATVPADLPVPGTALVTVVSSGSRSNSVELPTASASPGIYSVSGSGFGQGYILNSDGSLNSPDNPAPVGSAITIFANGVGLVTFDGPYAVTAEPVSVFIDGFYANGISASIRQADGLSGSVYAISVYIPDPSQFAAQNPNLLNFKMPPQVSVLLVVGPVNRGNPAFSTSRSQQGLALSVKPS
ncbi:MAG: SBBP repeat-containing protein [Bryobacteraceae bacterium]